jgi:hypothetical protein
MDAEKKWISFMTKKAARCLVQSQLYINFLKCHCYQYRIIIILFLWCFSFPDFRLTASIKRQEGVSLCENCCETIVSLCVPRSVHFLHFVTYSVAVVPVFKGIDICKCFFNALMLRRWVLYGTLLPILSRHLNIEIPVIDFLLVVTSKLQKREWKSFLFSGFHLSLGLQKV